MVRKDVDELIAFLQELTELDPVAMGALIGHRKPCNSALANHPTAQAQKFVNGSAVGFLGIINGYAGIIEEGKYKGWGPIAAVVEKDGRCTGFRRTEL